MIQHLHLENIAVIESMDVAMEPGLIVLTGEAGAGKSLLLDALGWAFGDPLSPKEVMRSGATQARIELVWEWQSVDQIPNGVLSELPEAFTPSTTWTLIREVSPSGSRFAINGHRIPKTVLTQLKPTCLEVQGQHAATHLFRPAYQRNVLDSLGGEQVVELKRNIAKAYERWYKLNHRLKHWQDQQQRDQERAAFLRYQLESMEELNLTNPNEDMELMDELEVLSQAEHVTDSLEQLNALFSGDGYGDGLADRLDDAKGRLKTLGAIAKDSKELGESVDTALELVKHVSHRVACLREDYQADPQRMESIQGRLSTLQSLKKRYGPKLSDVMATMTAWDEELVALDTQGIDYEDVEVKLQEAEAELAHHTNALSQVRRELAQQFSQQITPMLQQLAMASAKVDVAFEPVDWSPNGGEEIEFLFSANAGEPLRPLAKTASGGELSRVLLALTALSVNQNVNQGVEQESEGSTHDPFPVLILDEIDTGTSGETAQAIARMLIQLTRQHPQIVVVTHQPIVAAVADSHLHVIKTTVDDQTDNPRTISQLQAMEAPAQRRAVLNRMASGMDSDHHAVDAYIQRLMTQAHQWKTQLIPA